MSTVVPFTINITKIKYCELNKQKCARYKLLQVMETAKLPDSLWPSDEMKALELLESKLNETHKRLYGVVRKEILG
jgi:hypothetical protein